MTPKPLCPLVGWPEGGFMSNPLGFMSRRAYKWADYPKENYSHPCPRVLSSTLCTCLPVLTGTCHLSFNLLTWWFLENFHIFLLKKVIFWSEHFFHSFVFQDSGYKMICEKLFPDYCLVVGGRRCQPVSLWPRPPRKLSSSLCIRWLVLCGDLSHSLHSWLVWR